jgi:hypothetical protein
VNIVVEKILCVHHLGRRAFEGSANSLQKRFDPLVPLCALLGSDARQPVRVVAETRCVSFALAVCVAIRVEPDDEHGHLAAVQQELHHALVLAGGVVPQVLVLVALHDDAVEDAVDLVDHVHVRAAFAATARDRKVQYHLLYDLIGKGRAERVGHVPFLDTGDASELVIRIGVDTPLLTQNGTL